MTPDQRERAAKLAKEYRPSMDKDIIHAWGSDVAALLKEIVEPVGTFAISAEKDFMQVVDYGDDPTVSALLRARDRIMAFAGGKPNSCGNTIRPEHYEMAIFDAGTLAIVAEELQRSR